MGKRILLIRNVDPGAYGGGEVYQLLLADKMRKFGLEPIIVSSSEKLIREARAKDFKAVTAPFCRRQNWSGWRNILFPVYVLWQQKLKGWYKMIFKKYRPDVINIESRDDWIAATKAARELGIRVFWTDHVDFRSWVFENINIWYKNWIGKWVLKEMYKAEKVILISDFERNWLEEQLKNREYENLITVKNGVVDELKKFKKIKAREKSFVFLGRLVEQKGLMELIEAFKEIAQDFPDARLRIYGDGKEGDKYQKLAKGVRTIEFLGVTNDPLRALAENEIFVLPTHREGLSLSLLEASMMGKEIITTDVDGNSEIVQNGVSGILVPMGDIKKLLEAMRAMLENTRDAKEMGKCARNRFKENFDFDRIFEKRMLPLYNGEEEEV